MKILIKTNPQGKIEAFDQEGNQITDIGRIDIYVNSHGRASAVITFKDVDLDIEVEQRQI